MTREMRGESVRERGAGCLAVSVTNMLKPHPDSEHTAFNVYRHSARSASAELFDFLLVLQWSFFKNNWFQQYHKVLWLIMDSGASGSASVTGQT